VRELDVDGRGVPIETVPEEFSERGNWFRARLALDEVILNSNGDVFNGYHSSPDDLVSQPRATQSDLSSDTLRSVSRFEAWPIRLGAIGIKFHRSCRPRSAWPLNPSCARSCPPHRRRRNETEASTAGSALLLPTPAQWSPRPERNDSRGKCAAMAHGKIRQRRSSARHAPRSGSHGYRHRRRNPFCPRARRRSILSAAAQRRQHPWTGPSINRNGALCA
jgi:hypothetical protein